MLQVYRFTILVLCVSAAALAKFDESLLTEEQKNLMTNLHQTCVEQIGIDEAQVDKLKHAVFEDDEKTKCYVKCVMSESGVMDENGEFDKDALAEVIPEKIREKTKETFESCVKNLGEIHDRCEKAFKILQCGHDTDPENYFFS